MDPTTATASSPQRTVATDAAATGRRPTGTLASYTPGRAAAAACRINRSQALSTDAVCTLHEEADGTDSASAQADHGCGRAWTPTASTTWSRTRRATAGRATPTVKAGRSAGGNAPPYCGCTTASRSAAWSPYSQKPSPPCPRP